MIFTTNRLYEIGFYMQYKKHLLHKIAKNCTVFAAEIEKQHILYT